MKPKNVSVQKDTTIYLLNVVDINHLIMLLPISQVAKTLSVPISHIRYWIAQNKYKPSEWAFLPPPNPKPVYTVDLEATARLKSQIKKIKTHKWNSKNIQSTKLLG